ncbi:hypothetical protein MNBD_GAMMA02-589 [hydrothermal vent metagenome]|uniref:DUF1318 domain-containing protein n=1 Tax=hydrothermal vent metagenome TaxID=652676 RepID=A0A3B0VYN1_9ZZZZ
MNKWYKSLLVGSFVFVAACVTINVYFPAAEVDSAAEKIVKDILNDEIDGDQNNGNDQSSFFNGSDIRRMVHQMNPINWMISSVHAQQADITLSSPAINEITVKLKGRFNDLLKVHLDNNVVGFTNDGLVEIVDAGQLGLKDRQSVKKLVADENRDRVALYREMAIANNHPEWEEQITNAFVKQWISQAKPGWSYQNAAGQWVKK